MLLEGETKHRKERGMELRREVIQQDNGEGGLSVAAVPGDQSIQTGQGGRGVKNRTNIT